MTDPSGQGYPGQQGISDNTSDFTMTRFHIWSILGRVRTMVPVKVSAVHANGDDSGGFVDAQPLVDQMDGGGNTFAHGVVFNLPYFQLQAGANAVVLDPKVGDIGIAGICDRDISSVKANKGRATPGSRRRFSLADGVYFPGILNGVPDQKIKFTDTGIEIDDKNGNKLVSSSTGWTFTGNVEFKNNLQVDGHVTGVDGTGAINLNVPLVSSAEITANGIPLSTHRHTGVTTGAGDTGGPTP